MCALTAFICVHLCTANEPRSFLEHALQKSGSDKAMPRDGGAGYHGYSRYYKPIMQPRRSANTRLVEIGVENGRSLRVWQEYFKSANHIYGIGYGNFQVLQREQCSAATATYVARSAVPCTIFKGDQGNVTFLRQFVQVTGGKYDIVIDDGSHLPSHQRISFETLWPHVAPAGYYIIEDVETSFWSKDTYVYGYALERESSFVAHMKDAIESVNAEFSNNAKLPELYNDISSIQFGRNIIVVKKMESWERRVFLNRRYRWPHKIPRKI